MAESTRFPVAVHILALLANESDRALTSDYIAGSVNTNPVVIRRMLGLLNKAGLVTSTEGAGGGTTLARAAEEITLGDVYGAVETGKLFSPTRNDPNPLCPVGRRIQDVLKKHIQRFDTALQKEMKQVTLAEVLEGVRSPAGR